MNSLGNISYLLIFFLALANATKAHGMRNELYISLKWLHRLVPCSRLFWEEGRNASAFWKLESKGGILSSRFTAEIQLVAQPVGSAHGLRNELIASKLYSTKRLHEQSRSHCLLGFQCERSSASMQMLWMQQSTFQSHFAWDVHLIAQPVGSATQLSHWRTNTSNSFRSVLLKISDSGFGPRIDWVLFLFVLKSQYTTVPFPSQCTSPFFGDSRKTKQYIY